jgi:hypothetical protein
VSKDVWLEYHMAKYDKVTFFSPNNREKLALPE